MSERAAFERYRAAMAALGFRPSSQRGQNFLLDPTLHAWLADQAGATADDTVVEIGVGLGFLTRELATRAGRVVGIEVDERLFTLASRELGGGGGGDGDAAPGNVELVLGDAMGGPDRSLLPVIGESIASAQAAGHQGLLVANLPYSISGPLLAGIATLPDLPQRAILLVQKELALRVAAAAGTPDYGGLSALLQVVFEATVLRDVSPQVFRPRPKVTSAVLQLDRRAVIPDGLVPAAARRRFAAFVRALFQQRRKVLRTTLPRAAAAIGSTGLAGSASTWPFAHAEELGGQRAEQLAPTAIHGLFRALSVDSPSE
ncbi:MAG: 16S rRNA (adenine(1518)-N(6)/adenine(1519)-N(6))-dimethyltransferase RsmA [bacterium]|nr:16S rRNA (adenine(1518)-N(6)/adenine(1519)-N(6))-dimethyltransferase RsmA [bacterium]